jgi:hypothetical protein
MYWFPWSIVQLHLSLNKQTGYTIWSVGHAWGLVFRTVRDFTRLSSGILYCKLNIKPMCYYRYQASKCVYHCPGCSETGWSWSWTVFQLKDNCSTFFSWHTVLYEPRANTWTWLQL